jgi:hypothetical protein
VAIPEVAADDEREQPEEAAPIVVVEIDEAVPDTAGSYVEDSVRKVAATHPWHADDRNGGARRLRRRWPIVTLL